MQNNEKCSRWSKRKVWVRQYHSNDAEQYEAFLPEGYDLDSGDGDIGSHDNMDNRGNDTKEDSDEELVWIKWESTKGVTQVRRSQISLELRPVSRSRRRRCTTYNATNTTRAEADDDATVEDPKRGTKRSSRTTKKVASKGGRKKQKKSEQSNEETSESQKDKAIMSPLSKFLVKGVNSARNSSCPNRPKAKTVGPLSRFLVEGVDSTRNSSRDVAIEARRSLHFTPDEVKSEPTTTKEEDSIFANPTANDATLTQVKQEEDEYGYETE